MSQSHLRSFHNTVIFHVQQVLNASKHECHMPKTIQIRNVVDVDTFCYSLYQFPWNGFQQTRSEGAELRGDHQGSKVSHLLSTWEGVIETGDVGHNSLLIRPQSAHDIYSKASRRERERERNSGEAKQPKACEFPLSEQVGDWGSVETIYGLPHRKENGVRSPAL